MLLPFLLCGFVRNSVFFDELEPFYVIFVDLAVQLVDLLLIGVDCLLKRGALLPA
jgi:hypothetical protein